MLRGCLCFDEASRQVPYAILDRIKSPHVPMSRQKSARTTRRNRALLSRVFFCRQKTRVASRSKALGAGTFYRARGGRKRSRNTGCDGLFMWDSSARRYLSHTITHTHRVSSSFVRAVAQFCFTFWRRTSRRWTPGPIQFFDVIPVATLLLPNLNNQPVSNSLQKRRRCRFFVLHARRIYWGHMPWKLSGSPPLHLTSTKCKLKFCKSILFLVFNLCPFCNYFWRT